MLLVPTALASSGLTALRIEVAGSADVQGDAAAVFAIADDRGLFWEITAQSATLTRRWIDIYAVDHPTKPGDQLFTEAPAPFGWTEETETFTSVIITSSGLTQPAALLALGHGASLATSGDSLQIVSRLDPVIEQLGEEKTAEVGDADRGYVKAQLAGDHFVATLPDATTTMAGDITLQLFGPAYTLVAQEGELEERTGQYEKDRAGLAFTGRREHHELVLTGASMRLLAPGDTQVFTKYPEIAFEGTLTAEGADGAILLGAEEIVATDGALSWTGAGTFSLAPSEGKLLATSVPEAGIATTGAIVDSGPRIAIVSAALAVLAIAAVVGLVVWRTRSRRDDLATAILAMEERRWGDALAPLTRLAKKEPANANVLVDRALVLEELGRMREAAHAFEKALRAAPRHAEAHFYYARTLAKMRESEAARVHLETALEHDPRLVELARGEKVLRGL